MKKNGGTKKFGEALSGGAAESDRMKYESSICLVTLRHVTILIFYAAFTMI